MNTNPNKLLFFNEELIKYIVLKDYTYLFMFRLVINDDITLPAMAELPISQKDIPALQNLTTRNLIISTKKEWKQSPLPGSTIISTTLDANHGIISYKNVVTTIDVALNLEETDNIVEKYDEALCYELLQQIFSFILYKTNATSNGRQWYNLSLSACGPQQGGIYKVTTQPNYTFTLHSGLIRCHYRSDNLRLSSHSSSLLDEKVFIWKYYYNRALSAFNNANLLDFILNGTLAIESFFYYLLRKNRLKSEFDNYLLTQNQNSAIPAGGFTIIKFLQTKSIITKQEATLFKKVQGKLTKYRNDIIHGKIENPNELAYINALSACNSLQEMFNNIESKELSSIKHFKTVNFSLVNKLKDKIEKIVVESQGFTKISDFSELKKDLYSLINYNVDLPTCYYYLGEIYRIEKNYEKAIDNFKQCIFYNRNIGYAAFGLAIIYNILGKIEEEKGMITKAIHAICNKNVITPKAINTLEKLHVRAFFFELYEDCFLALKTCFISTHDKKFAFYLYKIAEIIERPDFFIQEAKDLLKQHNGELFSCYDYFSLINQRNEFK